MNAGELDKLLANNVVSLSFIKKTTNTRRDMLCTKSFALLDSVVGRMELSYKPPKTAPKYNPTENNNLIVWDINLKAFRQISCNSVDIKEVIPDEDYRQFLISKI